MLLTSSESPKYFRHLRRGELRKLQSEGNINVEKGSVLLSCCWSARHPQGCDISVFLRVIFWPQSEKLLLTQSCVSEQWDYQDTKHLLWLHSCHVNHNKVNNDLKKCILFQYRLMLILTESDRPDYCSYCYLKWTNFSSWVSVKCTLTNSYVLWLLKCKKKKKKCNWNLW